MSKLLLSMFLVLLSGCAGIERGALDTDLKSEIKAELKAELSAEFEAKINTQAQAQAGVNQRLDSRISDFKQTLSAGHDLNNTNTVQFNENMLDALKSANETTVETNTLYARILLALIGLAGTIVSLIYRQRAKEAHAEVVTTRTELATTRGRLERAIGMIPPAEFERAFPPKE